MSDERPRPLSPVRSAPSTPEQEAIEELRRENEDLRVEVRYLQRSGTTSAIAQVAMTLIRYGTFGFMAWVLYLSVKALAGQTTDANIQLVANFLEMDNVSELLAWLFGVSGLLYGARQRELRRDTIEELGVRNSELERIVDSDRSSSSLTRRGETPKRD